MANLYCHKATDFINGLQKSKFFVSGSMPINVK